MSRPDWDELWDELLYQLALAAADRPTTPRDRAVARRVQTSIEALITGTETPTDRRATTRNPMRAAQTGAAQRQRRRPSKGQSR